jgi:hypothetical protein
LKDPGVAGRIIFKLTFKKWDGSMNWISVAKDKSKWLVLVNVVINL